MKEWTDEEIIAGMNHQASFTESLRDQIGEIKGTKIDREQGFIHFYGPHRNCTFELGKILTSLDEMEKKGQELKKITFT